MAGQKLNKFHALERDVVKQAAKTRHFWTWGALIDLLIDREVNREIPKTSLRTEFTILSINSIVVGVC